MVLEVWSLQAIRLGEPATVAFMLAEHTIPGAETHDLTLTVDVEKIISILLSLSQIPDLLGLSKDRQILTLYSWVICKEH